jgi:hypothetical protein
VGSLAYPEPPESIIHLPLAQVLPDGVVLALHRKLGFVALLTCHEQHPQVKAAQFFPPSEMLVLLPVMLSYPHFCHYETLFAGFSGGTTEADVEKARRLPSCAKERGKWDMMMRPVRNMLSRARLKLHPLGITVLSLFETGYVLEAHTADSLRRKRVRASIKRE